MPLAMAILIVSMLWLYPPMITAGAPDEPRGQAQRAWSIPSYQRGRCDDHATVLHPKPIVARHC
jgi:hypothetical protein